MDQQKPTTPQPANLVLWAIWGALTSSIVVYLFVIQNFAEQREAAEKGFDLLPRVLASVAVFHLAISFIVRKRLGRLDGGDPEWFGRVLTLSIVSWALVEAIAVYGLVLGMSGYPLRVYGGFILTGFVALVILAPTFAKLDRR